MAEQYKTKDRNGTFYYKDPAKTIRHREDGPAIEWGFGDKAWYVNGVFIFELDKNGKLIRRME